MNTETQLAAAEKIANREPEDEPEPEQELAADEMDRIDARNEARSNRYNGR
jgi:hypothetical protein